MARTAKCEVGEIVYEAYAPQNPGIIRQIGSGRAVLVEWLKPKLVGDTRKRATVVSRLILKNFEALVEEHERKGRNGRKLYEELKEKA